MITVTGNASITCQDASAAHTVYLQAVAQGYAAKVVKPGRLSKIKTYVVKIEVPAGRQLLIMNY